MSGNRVQETIDTGNDGTTDATINYTYSNDDQLLTETRTGTQPYQILYGHYNGSTFIKGYDANGSLTEQTRTGTNPETDTYTWDLRNRLSSATVNGTVTTYTYDTDGTRASETTAGTATYYLNDPLNPTGYTKAVEEKPSLLSAPTRSYVIAQRVEAQHDTTNGTLYLLADGHGSTRALLNSSGAVQEIDDYDAYGTRLESGSSKTIWQQPDGARDLSTQWTYQLARFRGGFWFASRDSITVLPGDTGDANLQVYVAGNPINSDDADGHFLTGEVGVSSASRVSLMSILLPAAGLALLVGGALYGALHTPAGAGSIVDDDDTGGSDTLAGLKMMQDGDGSGRAIVSEQYYSEWIATAQMTQQDTMSKQAARKYGQETKANDPNNIPIYYLPEDRFQEVADHDMWCILHNYSALLHYNGGGTARKLNRAAAFAAYTGRPKRDGEQLDEYPYAATQEGGADASVWPLNGKQNERAGGDFGNFVRAKHLTVGSPFIVKIVPTRPWNTYTN